MGRGHVRREWACACLSWVCLSVVSLVLLKAAEQGDLDPSVQVLASEPNDTYFSFRKPETGIL